MALVEMSVVEQRYRLTGRPGRAAHRGPQRIHDLADLLLADLRTELPRVASINTSGHKWGHVSLA
jgi:glutamate/tyrosine decarboxylase-like PLP-dependent enzyme